VALSVTVDDWLEEALNVVVLVTVLSALAESVAAVLWVKAALSCSWLAVWD